MPPLNKALVCVGLVGSLVCACKGVVDDPRGQPAAPTTNKPPPTRAPPPGAEGPYVASESVARRLSQTELDRTLDALFEDSTNPASTYLGEDEYSPYDNDYTLQVASGAMIDGLHVLAKDVADRLIADTARRDRLVGCTPDSDGDEVCFRSFLARFLRRAFRRAIPPAELDPYVALLAYATEDNPDVDNDFYTAVALTIRAVIQDPEFLYRIEVGVPDEATGALRLNGFEIATRLSYLLWGTTPDDALLDAAEAGTLSSAEGRRTVATTMMADARAREQIHRFHAMWLGYRTIPHDATLVAAFNRETNALIDRVVFDEQQPYTALFQANETYVDDQLAAHYGLPAPEGGEGWVPYGDRRAGILSHGAVLAAFSKFTDTSPTQRGIFVRTRLMCDELPPPPPDVDVDQPPTGGATNCKTDQYKAHMSGSCASCHSQMDPIGFGLERFDVAGRFREHDDGREECGLDGNGTLPDGSIFNGPKQLAEILTANKEITTCAAEQFYRFSVGRGVQRIEREAIGALATSFEASGYRLDQMIVDHVASDAFALRREVTP